MPTREEITYILIDDQMPNNENIAPLSDAAFRLYVEAQCWCSANHKDGVILKRIWLSMGTPKAREDLITAARVIDHGTHVEIHDYLDIQRSQAEIAELKAKKSLAGVKGNHRRHHVNKGIRDDDCPLCLKGVA